MNQKEKAAFEKYFGYSIPTPLKKLLEDQSLRAASPMRYQFANVSFAIEIQYMADLEDESNYDRENHRLIFAVSTDGHPLLVDLSDAELKVMQNEFGDVDYLGITIQDLLEANRTSL